MGTQFTEFVKTEVLAPRLKSRGCMVVYDPERRYLEVCRSMDSPAIRVIDVSESSLEGRNLALKGLADLGEPQSKLEGLLVYVPGPKPILDEQKQADPFALYAECGAVFPEDDGDEFKNLCLKARADLSFKRSGLN